MYIYIYRYICVCVLNSFQKPTTYISASRVIVPAIIPSFLFQYFWLRFGNCHNMPL